jgi:transposase
VLRPARQHRPNPSQLRQNDPLRLHRGGDRQLNRTIHIIALGRVAWDPDTRAYIQRKQAEGKTKLEAIRCLKRHIARQIWHLLDNTQPHPQPPPSQRPKRVALTAAPGLMPCTR